MSVLATAASVALSVLYTPFLLFILCIIFLASIGKSLGVRRLYVDILLKLFEYGRQHIEVAKLIKRTDSSSEDDEEDEGAGDRPPSAALRAQRPNGINGVSKATVIKRDEILAPDPDMNYKRTASQERLGARSPPPPPQLPADTAGAAVTADTADTAGATVTDVAPPAAVTETQPDFNLSVCLDLVKAGMEAIIEDQVTLVFEAEELRSWNLLTRTNRQYEFITWRLTVIWMMGFLVRYFFLLPLRILICFIGIVTMLTLTVAVSGLPPSRFKRFIGELCFKISFRCLMRGTSCVITYHDLQYAPNGNGFCVANHTSPIDVAILASRNCFTLVWWLILCTACVGCLPDGSFKRRANFSVSVMCFEMLSRSLSAVITYHHPENRPRTGICVANHTSPIDVLVLMCDNCYALIGQSHGGFLGLLQRALARASPHIWFERSEVKDRSAVARRLKEHISEPNNPPILIFPEGTCINNTSVMQFKKGSFEVGGTIYPVAIKYDARFGDAFWNSSRYGMLQYLYMMMSSWAIVCDVWYLPPMRRAAHESAIEFANRVKAVIARRGGLVDLMWDGQLKRIKPKKEWKELQQEEVSRRLKGE